MSDISWARAGTVLRHLSLYKPPLSDEAPHPADVLAGMYANEPIETNSDAAMAIEVGLAAMGVDTEEDGPGERLLRNVLAYLRLETAEARQTARALSLVAAMVMLLLSGAGAMIVPSAFPCLSPLL